MIKLTKADKNKEYIIVRLTIKWMQTQTLGKLGMFTGVKIKIVDKMHDIMRIKIGAMVYIFGQNVTDNIILEPV